MSNNHEVWPPPPTLDTPTPPTVGPSRTERRWGLAALWLSLAWVMLSVLCVVLAIVLLATGHRGGAAIQIPNVFGVLGMVSGAASLVAGVMGRRTVPGKVGIIVTLLLTLLLGFFYWVGSQAMR